MRGAGASRRGAAAQSVPGASPPIGLHARLLAVLFLLPASCAEDEADTALDLKLTPDPNLGSAEQIAAQIDTVLLVVDSPEGLYPLSAARVVGNLQIKNVDADATWLEVVVTVPVAPGRLPWIRLRKGGLPERPLDIRVGGLRTMGGPVETVALGRVQGLRFAPGSTAAVSIPFNIRPEALPPRVLEVLPADGTSAPGCRIEQIAVLFSKPIAADSLDASGAIVVTSDAAPAGVTATDLRLEASGFVAIYVPAALEDPGAATLSYRVSVGTVVRDRNGIGFDQVPAEAGAQAYAADFVLRCDPPPAVPSILCGSGVTDSPAACPDEGRLTCVDDECLPVDCRERCPGSWSCVEAIGRCEVNCTLYGGAPVCPPTRPYCDLDRGTCLAVPG